ncbi:MAG: putative lipoprotein NlpE involved in copper resistance [Planctomycetota bacterium]|jgi:uncharacterized lipoprotein NlpE involved in copper resistance
MKSALTLLALVTSLSLAGCTNKTDPGVTTVTHDITYIVSETGVNSVVTQVMYTDTDGATVTLNTPVLPWTVDATRAAGSSAALAVTGTTGATSTITAIIQDDPDTNPSPVTHASQTCLENTDPCTINLSNAF